MPLISAEERRAIASFISGGLYAVATVLVAHLWMALNIALAIHPLLALVYAIFPPVAAMAMAGLLARFATFSLLVAGVFFFSLSTICILFGRRLLGMPAIAYLVYLPFFVIWLPVASGEIVRTAGMYSAIVAVSPECYETSGFIASLHDHDEHAQAHAWMIKDGKRYIWSYSELRFVADSRPWRSGGTCRPSGFGVGRKLG
jgi:hypothetical protein